MLENFMVVVVGDSFKRHGDNRPRFEFVVIVMKERRSMAINTINESTLLPTSNLFALENSDVLVSTTC